MNRLIQTRASEFPRDADLVVGLPRSGLMAATFVSLALNLPLADLDGFLEGRILAAGSTRRRASFDLAAHEFHRVLVIDDSLLSGKSMQEARDKVAAAGLSGRCVFSAIYGTEDKNELADIVLDTVPWPRVFQWNLMNHHILQRACLDLDGVLCFDPPYGIERNETQYVDFLQTARPMLVPGRPVAHIVTSRSERYR